MKVNWGQNAKLSLAGIDIGSNAIRLAIGEVHKHKMTITQKYRVPIRLGGDVFEYKKISPKKIKETTMAFRQFRKIIDSMQISIVRAVGTSAVREARNAKQFINSIKKNTGINIEIIDGVSEASLIHLAVKKQMNISQQNCLLLDIGGGSVELTFSEKGMTSATQSFPFGTVRTLERLKQKKWSENLLPLLVNDYIEPIQHFLNSHGQGINLRFLVGTGGNLDAIGRLNSLINRKRKSNYVSQEDLEKIIQKLINLTPKNRIKKLGLRSDRADVIMPATLITLIIMRLAKLNRLYLPCVGLKEGLLWSMLGESEHSV